MDDSWGEIGEAIAAAPYPVEVLAADAGRAAACLAALGISNRSWLGALVAAGGGLIVDHGWLRVLGSGTPAVAVEDGRVVVGYDVLGGEFAWLAGAGASTPTVHYFAPDELAWQDLEVGYAEWLDSMLRGAITSFYDGLRWPGWESEVAALAPDQGLSLLPPPWTSEGKDLAAVSRRPIPLAELVAVNRDMARQLGG